VVFEKEYIMRRSSAEWISTNGCALRWCYRVFGRQTEETVGFPEWTAQFCVWKTTGIDSSEVCAIACHNCAVTSVFPSGMTSHSKIVQFNWECIGPFTNVWCFRKEISLKNVYFFDIYQSTLSAYSKLTTAELQSSWQLQLWNFTIIDQHVKILVAIGE
jgi:hypothetical protein